MFQCTPCCSLLLCEEARKSHDWLRSKDCCQYLTYRSFNVVVVSSASPEAHFQGTCELPILRAAQLEATPQVFLQVGQLRHGPTKPEVFHPEVGRRVPALNVVRCTLPHGKREGRSCAGLLTTSSQRADGEHELALAELCSQAGQCWRTGCEGGEGTRKPPALGVPELLELQAVGPLGRHKSPAKENAHFLTGRSPAHLFQVRHAPLCPLVRRRHRSEFGLGVRDPAIVAETDHAALCQLLAETRSVGP
mmetsp:Transcript_139139/g.388167  ORF Transcript_139139/g.388167 Transcript_139139/m.388167 type:complete len:249 (+) Transcript_139139:408-1154(+)